MFGEKIRKLRKEANLNQADLAIMTGVSRPNVSFWEKADYPPLEAIVKICRALDINLSDFFKSEDENAKDNTPREEISTVINQIQNLPIETQDEILKITLQLTKSFKRLTPQKIISEGGTDNYPESHIENFIPTAYGRKAGYHAMEQYFSRFMWISTSMN